MDFIIPGIALLVIAFALLAVIAALTSRTKADFLAKDLMTKRERKAIDVIERLHPNARVHAQVAMGAILKVHGGADKKKRHSLRNKFSQKIVDFVLEERETGQILALIELDDRTHNTEKDRVRDAMTASAGYETIRIPPKTKLDETTLLPFFERTSNHATRNLPAMGSPSRRRFGSRAA